MRALLPCSAEAVRCRCRADSAAYANHLSLVKEAKCLRSWRDEYRKLRSGPRCHDLGAVRRDHSQAPQKSDSHLRADALSIAARLQRRRDEVPWLLRDGV